MIIDVNFIGGYCWLLLVIILMAIGVDSISEYCSLLYCGYSIVIILLVAIGYYYIDGYSINGY
jgi:hypothetical protein